jgi:hypothetical protein
MGSSKDYWLYARECARAAAEADQNDDKDVLLQMSQAWTNIALLADDVAGEILPQKKSKQLLHS